jgi:hypothetical protein
LDDPKSIVPLDNYCIFEACKYPELEPDFISKSGSKYWITPNGIVRNSDHWGFVADSYYKKNGKGNTALLVFSRGKSENPDFYFTNKQISPEFTYKNMYVNGKMEKVVSKNGNSVSVLVESKVVDEHIRTGYGSTISTKKIGEGWFDVTKTTSNQKHYELKTKRVFIDFLIDETEM